MTTEADIEKAWSNYAQKVCPYPITAQIKNAWKSGYLAAISDMEDTIFKAKKFDEIRHIHALDRLADEVLDDRYSGKEEK